MKKFISLIFSCLAILLCFNFLYSFTVDGYMRGYERGYLKLPHSVNLLVLGDSHAELAWRKDTNRADYNFAHSSDNIEDMVYKFNYVLSHTSPVEGKKTIVLSFDPHLISAYRAGYNNIKLNELLNTNKVNKYLIYNLPLFFDTKTQIDFKNFISRKKDNYNNADKFNGNKFMRRFNDQFPSSKESALLIAGYQQLIDRIKNNGYHIIGIKYPVHPYYDSLIKNSPNSVMLASVMDSLAAVNHITVTDFSAVIKDIKYFMNQDHVNSEGSKLFISKFFELNHF